MLLEPGKFYVTHEGSRWCCYLVDLKAPLAQQARCVEVATGRIDHFYLDGRQDVPEGHRDNTLVGRVADRV